MIGNAERCIANTLVYEGGFTIIKSDPGNWTGGKVGVGELKGTNFGIAANTYPNLDIRNLSKAEAIAIYQRDWWPRVGGDILPAGIDQVTYDAAVNSGPSRGLQWSAKAAGAKSNSAPAIQEALKSTADMVPVVKRACANRMSFLHSLATFGKFGAGWTRRVAAIEAIGVKMALEVTNTKADVKVKLEKEKSSANTSVKKNSGASAGTAGGGTAATQTLDHSTFDVFMSVVFYGGMALVVGVAIYFGIRAWQHRQRANAYADAAAGKIGG